MKFLKPSKLKIILTIPLLLVGVFGVVSFMVGASLGMDSTIASVLLSGSLVDTFLELLSAGGIIGLILGNFLPTFIPVIILIAIVGTFQLVWSYFLSCLLIFLGKKLFAKKHETKTF